jgi:hypothetical protein
MGHSISGFDVAYTSRTSWKAEVRGFGRSVIAPVAWVHGRSQVGGEVFQAVWYQDAKEMENYRVSGEPFVVAVARAKDSTQHPRQFEEFLYVVEVTATGQLLSENSIQTKVLRRLTSKDFADA